MAMFNLAVKSPPWSNGCSIFLCVWEAWDLTSPLCQPIPCMLHPDMQLKLLSVPSFLPLPLNPSVHDDLPKGITGSNLILTMRHGFLRFVLSWILFSCMLLNVLGPMIYLHGCLSCPLKGQLLLTSQEFRDALAVQYRKHLLCVPPCCDGCDAPWL